MFRDKVREYDEFNVWYVILDKIIIKIVCDC